MLSARGRSVVVLLLMLLLAAIAPPARAASDGEMQRALVSPRAAWQLADQSGSAKSTAPQCERDKNYGIRTCSRFWSGAKDGTVSPWFASVGVAASEAGAKAILAKTKNAKTSGKYMVVASTSSTWLSAGPWPEMALDIAAGMIIRGPVVVTASCYGPHSLQAKVITCARAMLAAQIRRAAQVLSQAMR